MKNFFLNLRRSLARFISPDKGKLFFVLKFGGKIYLRVTEDELRAQVQYAGGVGVQYKDKSLVFQCYEVKENAPQREN